MCVARRGAGSGWLTGRFTEASHTPPAASGDHHDPYRTTIEVWPMYKVARAAEEPSTLRGEGLGATVARGGAFCGRTLLHKEFLLKKCVTAGGSLLHRESPTGGLAENITVEVFCYTEDCATREFY